MKTKLALTPALRICIQLTGEEPGTLLGGHKARESDHHVVSDQHQPGQRASQELHFANGAKRGTANRHCANTAASAKPEIVLWLPHSTESKLRIQHVREARKL